MLAESSAADEWPWTAQPRRHEPGCDRSSRATQGTPLQACAAETSAPRRRRIPWPMPRRRDTIQCLPGPTTMSNEYDTNEPASSETNHLTDADRVAAIWNLPYQRNPNFTGRGRLLADVARAFEGGKSALARVQTIVGLGGIGKTQLAVEFCYRHRWHYRVIWWVPSEDLSTLSIVYAQLARQF